MNDVDHDADVANKDECGNVTAKNQDGQTAEEILDDAEETGDAAETAEVYSCDVTFTYTITVRAVDADAAVLQASDEWNRRPRVAEQMIIESGLAK